MRILSMVLIAYAITGCQGTVDIHDVPGTKDVEIKDYLDYGCYELVLERQALKRERRRLEDIARKEGMTEDSVTYRRLSLVKGELEASWDAYQAKRCASSDYDGTSP